MIRAEITCSDFAGFIQSDGLDAGFFLGMIVVAEAKQFVHASGEGDGAQVLPGDFLLPSELGLGAA